MTLYAVPDLPEDGEPEPVWDENGWQQHGLCRGADPNMWFIGRTDSPKPARDTCARCPVKDPCLKYAMDHNEKYGIWGGLTERQRRRLRTHHVYPHGTTGAFRNGCSCDRCKTAWRAHQNARGF